VDKKVLSMDLSYFAWVDPFTAACLGTSVVVLAGIIRTYTMIWPSDNVMSAHSTIASYDGTSKDKFAGFTVQRYLRYAFMSKDASRLQRNFTINIGTADAQVEQLTSETEGVLSRVVAGFEVGDRVELDWIEVRLGEGGKVVTQVEMLGKLSKADEERLVQKYPETQMITNMGGESGFYEM